METTDKELKEIRKTYERVGNSRKEELHKKETNRKVK